MNKEIYILLLFLLIMVFVSGGIRLIQEMKSHHASEEMERLIHTKCESKKEEFF